MPSHPDFVTLREERIAELESTLRLFEHRATGARLLSVVNEDDNKVFGITFPTPPDDSTGAPHILEHSVLSGSERFPVREPFVELVKSSLNTFLNAMTYPDRTTYPVASQNLKDLQNLTEVYMDAVFHPLLPRRALEQEGWHYEAERAAPEGSQVVLRLKGVVYNEMKGVYSNPDALLGRYSRMYLLPDTPYAHESGGDPREIPELSYERFRDFHRRFYTPSNALVYFYGDDAEAARLDLVARAFAGYGRGSRAPAIPMQPRWTSPRVVRERYAAGADPASSKTMLAVNWLLGDHLDPERSLALNVLSHILLGTPAAPLRRALIESGLGEGLTGSGLDDENREAVFAVGLKGIEGARATEVEELINGTLAGLVRDGIDPDAVAAGMNSVEFMLRENNTGSYPRGLALMIRCLPSWIYTGDPFLSLAFEAPLRSLRRRLERGERVFEDLVRTELVENRHNLVVLLEPNPELGARIALEEETRLAATAATLRNEEVREIERRAEELERFQSTPDTPEALATIPSLRLDDIDRLSRRIPMEILKRGETTFLVHEIPTAGIVYLDVGFDFRGLDADLLPYLPLYARCLTEMGTARTDYVRLQQRIGRDTGGVAATLMVSSVMGTNKAAAWLFLRGKALVAEVDKLLGIMTEVLTEPALDNRERFGQMARESKARTESSVVPSGHSVVSSRLASKFDEAAWVRERMGGVDYLLAVRELAGRVQSDWPAVLAALERIHAAVVTRRGTLCNVTVTGSERAPVMARLEALPARLPDRPRAAGTWAPDWRRYDEGLTAPSQVNYAGKGGSLFDCGYRLRGSLFAVLNYVRATWIHEQVRVQGGAYGGMVQFDPVSGFLGYLSYRDPNLLSTLKAYDGTPAFLKEARVDSDELRRNIIGAVGDMDPCLLPDAQGYTSLRRYIAGVTDAERQRLRDELLATTESDFRDLAEPLRLLAERGTVVALGSPERIAEANAALGNRLHVTPLL